MKFSKFWNIFLAVPNRKYRLHFFKHRFRWEIRFITAVFATRKPSEAASIKVAPYSFMTARELVTNLAGN